MAGELDGHVAIVTGAGRGIGRAIVEALAAAGAAVAAVARSADQLAETVTVVEAARGRALALPADVTQWPALTQVVEETERRLGSVDLLVNNAGVPGSLGPFWEQDPEAWWRVLEVNLRGVALATRAVLPGMIGRGRGRIISIGSNVGIRASPWSSAYACSKAALIRFTDSVGASTEDYGVRLFTLSPGDVRTAMADVLEEDLAAAKAAGAAWARGIPDITERRFVPAERTGVWCVALASGRCDRLAGRYLHIADDLEALLASADQIGRDGLYTLRLPKLDGLAR
jgi:NAD(P)-dependent dehydrogenase (short-subunit alcohol dehydrogenase family)